MTKQSNGAPAGETAETPDYAEMANRLRDVGKALLQQGQKEKAADLVAKAQRILCLADQICPENGS